MPPIKPGFVPACLAFAACQTISTMALSKALKLGQISMVTALWKVSLLVLVVLGYFTLHEVPSVLLSGDHGAIESRRAERVLPPRAA